MKVFIDVSLLIVSSLILWFNDEIQLILFMTFHSSLIGMMIISFSFMFIVYIFLQLIVCAGHVYDNYDVFATVGIDCFWNIYEKIKN